MSQHLTGGPHRGSWRGLSRRPLPAQVALAAALVALAAALLLTACTSNNSSGSAAIESAAGGSVAVSTTALDVSPSAQALQQQFVKVVKQVGPAVVLIQTSEGLGSGIVFDSKGDIVTNNHVVDNAKGFRVTLPNGKQFAARLLGSFPADDLAVLHIDATGLRPAAFADSSRLAVGDVALAIGNPLGLQSSVTEGIVSALGRTVNEDNGVALPNVIQTSAAINPGNSGGALVNLQGQVIGIPTLAAADPQMGGGAAPGIGFAIPSNTVRDIASQIVSQGKVTRSHRAFMGVNVASITSGGVLVTGVQRGGPAAKAGIRAGELIVSINGNATTDPSTLAEILAGLQPGQTVSVVVVSTDGSRHTTRVTLGQLPG